MPTTSPAGADLYQRDDYATNIAESVPTLLLVTSRRRTSKGKCSRLCQSGSIMPWNTDRKNCEAETRDGIRNTPTVHRAAKRFKFNARQLHERLVVFSPWR